MTHHENIKKCSSVYGAVLFDSFDIVSSEEFASIIHKLGLKEMDEHGGLAVRRLIVGSTSRMNDMAVLTTNEFPPEILIPLHNEQAHMEKPPTHIMFYCRDNESEGGSTPMIRSDLVYEFILSKYPDFAKEVEEKGTIYIEDI